MNNIDEVKTALKRNLDNLYELTKPMFDDLRSEYIKKGLTERQIAEEILDNVFDIHHLDKDYNYGLYNAGRALLCVDGLKREDIVIILETENGEVVRADYTFPEWVPDEYAGISRIKKQ